MMSEPIFELSNNKSITGLANRKLLHEAKIAVAWGIPDTESRGYSASEFTKIINKLVHRIEHLEKENEQLRSKTS